MHPPPPLSDLPQYPATAGWGLAALGATLLSWFGSGFDPFVMDIRAWHGEPWRLVISALSHIDALHLIFNLGWLWIFGTFIERVLGSWPVALLAAFLAVTSAATEYALFSGGVGLSGVVYGLFGFIWVMSARDRRFTGGMNKQTIALMVGWFVLCCIMTAAGAWRIGNAAHAGGAVFGALAGLVCAQSSHARPAAIAALTLAAAAVIAGATIARPYVNLVGLSNNDVSITTHDLNAIQGEDAIARLEAILQANPNDADAWYHLGVALHRLDRFDESIAPYQKAIELKPDDERYRLAAAGMAAFLAYERQVAGKFEQASRFYRDSLALDGQSAQNWYNLALAYIQLHRFDDAHKALERAIEIDGHNHLYREALKMLPPKLNQF